MVVGGLKTISIAHRTPIFITQQLFFPDNFRLNLAPVMMSTLE
jgi:hypothetical protein